MIIYLFLTEGAEACGLNICSYIHFLRNKTMLTGCGARCRGTDAHQRSGTGHLKRLDEMFLPSENKEVSSNKMSTNRNQTIEKRAC